MIFTDEELKELAKRKDSVLIAKLAVACIEYRDQLRMNTEVMEAMRKAVKSRTGN